MVVNVCPLCGSPLESIHGEMRCINGHVIKDGEVLVLDCEIRDWERFGKLPQDLQEALLDVLNLGRIPKNLLPLMVRLRDAGVVVCT